ncbi:hypothetical protein [Phreatobacter oligotrophus]|uniref:Uncharacterized protein n=1 Tax=Phreatobacter oligotrophus TaxID=1122261 RepID=A0A2T4YLF2_9HYPH|nr:hypothetical protein [Phreatobacter oligotrophus]PTM43836.1 hypothetical protein C8P69_1421 [Phreatobacter oligotrophus]
MRALTIAVIDTQRLVKEAQRSMVEARAAIDDGVSQIADLAAALDAVRRAANALSDEPTPLYGHAAKLEEEIAGRLRRAHATNEADAAIREKALLMFIANPPGAAEEDENAGGLSDRLGSSWADASGPADRDAMLRRQGDAQTIGAEL